MKKNIKEYSDYHQLILDIGFMKRHWRHKYQTNVIRGFEKGKQQQNVSSVRETRYESSGFWQIYRYRMHDDS